MKEPGRTQRRPRRARRRLVALAVVLLVAGATSLAYDRLALPHKPDFTRTHIEVPLHFRPIVEGLHLPTYVSPIPGQPGAFVVLQKNGLIRLVRGGKLQAKPFLDLRPLVIRRAREDGLYSIAFHPHFSANGRVFVAYVSKPDGALVVAEYHVDPKTDQVSPKPTRTILDVPKPVNGHGGAFYIHNGGQLAFGPNDGDLYVSLGDGTQTYCTDLISQNLGTLWGKILRINVDGKPPYTIPADNPFVHTPGARGEIWAYGFRNPWRFTFGPDGSTIWVSDVGQATYEEIDRVVPGGDYGWPFLEGRFWSLKNNVKAMGLHRRYCEKLTQIPGNVVRYFDELSTARLRPPVVYYGHLRFDKQGGEAVTGGIWFHGSKFPFLRGRYLFADWVSGRLWALDAPPEGKAVMEQFMKTPMAITSMAEDQQGNLLVTDYAGGTVDELVSGRQ